MWRLNKINCTTKKLAFNKYFQTKTIDNETEYKRRRATAKKKDIEKDIVNTGKNLYRT